MTRWAKLALASVVLVAGCAQSRCGDSVAGGDSGSDGGSEPDAADCQPSFSLIQIGYAPTATCAAAGVSTMMVGIYDVAGRHLRDVSASCVDGTNLSEIPALEPGRYWLSIRIPGQIVAGGELLGDANCPSATLRWCAPLDVDVRACAPTVVPYVIGCSSGTTDCMGGA